MAEPTFKRDPAAEDAAIAKGIATKEQIEARGGINASGYYGDSYREGITLTDEEYAKAIRTAKESGATGGKIGAAVNVASGTKAYNYYLGQGLTPEQSEIISGYTSKGEPSKYASGITTAAANLYAKLQAGTISQTMFNNLLNRVEVNPNISTTGVVVSGSAISGYNPATNLYTASDGKTFSNSDAYVAYQANLDNQKANRQSAYDLLYQQFSEYGLGNLVTPLKDLIQSGISPSEFTLRLRETDAYKKRFAANAQRINQGLRALSEAEYIQLEDQYQNVMKRYGLPESYYTRGDMGIQQGFEKFIAGDVSATELEDRIQTAYNRVINAAPEVTQTLRSFYPEISDGDILAYALDPSKAIENIKRKVTAAEIGGAATQAGLATGLTRAEELQRYGVTGEAARQGFQTIAGYLPRATTLGDIYAKQGMGPFTQTTAESEIFGTAGAAEAAAKRKKLSELEQAQFGGSAGVAGGALGRERAGQF